MTDDDEKPAAKSRSWLERLTSLVAREPQDREQLMEILRDAEERNILSNEMLGMIERILQVSEMQVRDVMVPKGQMASIRKNMEFDELLPIVIESGHSRFPVVDPTDKEIVGILLAKDLLQFCLNKEHQHFDINDIIRPAFYTPQSKRLDILLREFRINRNHIAIVLDEYGHLEGLVTIEDVLEQIVGEIEDEYDIDDEEDTSIKKIAEDCIIVKASTLIEEFNDYFQTDFSDDEFDTIGGIVLQAFGRLPKRDASIKIEGYKFKVLNSDNRRIYLLEVKTIKPRKKDNTD